jgi:hypothetical protein
MKQEYSAHTEIPTLKKITQLSNTVITIAWPIISENDKEEIVLIRGFSDISQYILKK